MDATEVKTLNDLPELPFERVLNHLSLRDRLRLSAVSRSCHAKIANSRVKSLCFSKHPAGFIFGKNRWVSGAFAENFISSTRFESFFKAFGHSVLSNLKHLRFCDLNLDLENKTAFARTVNSFGQLEQLDIIRAKCSSKRNFRLSLPMLISIHLEDLHGVKQLILDAPRLREIKLMDSSPFFPSTARLELVHGESVERVTAHRRGYLTVKKLKNLKYLSFRHSRKLDSAFLSDLKQLQEIHVDYGVSELFKQKQRYGRDNLKIYLYGWLMNGPDDPTVRCSDLDYLSQMEIDHMAANPSRLADVIPFRTFLSYGYIDRIAPDLEVNVLKRFTQLTALQVRWIVSDIQRFLDLLKVLQNIVNLEFFQGQPQQLFDRLPDYCAVQRLAIHGSDSDVRPLLRLKHLQYLDVSSCRLDAKLVRDTLEGLPFLSCFKFFDTSHHSVTIRIGYPKQFEVSVDGYRWTTVSDLNAAIELIYEAEQLKKRKLSTSEDHLPGLA